MEDNKRPRGVEHGEEENDLPDAKRHCPEPSPIYGAEKTSNQGASNQKNVAETQVAHSASTQLVAPEPSPNKQATASQTPNPRYEEDIQNAHPAISEGSHDSEPPLLPQEPSVEEGEVLESPHKGEQPAETPSNPQNPVGPEAGIAPQLFMKEEEAPEQNFGIGNRGEQEVMAQNLLKPEPIPIQQPFINQNEAPGPRSDGEDHDTTIPTEGCPKTEFAHSQNTMVEESATQEAKSAEGDPSESKAHSSQLPLVKKDEAQEPRPDGEDHGKYAVVARDIAPIPSYESTDAMDFESDAGFSSHKSNAAEQSHDAGPLSMKSATEEFFPETQMIEEERAYCAEMVRIIFDKNEDDHITIGADGTDNTTRAAPDAQMTEEETVDHVEGVKAIDQFIDENKSDDIMKGADGTENNPSVAEAESTTEPSSPNTSTPTEPTAQGKTPTVALGLEIRSGFPEQTGLSNDPVRNTHSQFETRDTEMNLGSSSSRMDESMGAHVHENQNDATVVQDKSTTVEEDDENVPGTSEASEEPPSSHTGGIISAESPISSSMAQQTSFPKKFGLSNDIATNPSDSDRDISMGDSQSFAQSKFPEELKLPVSSPEADLYNLSMSSFEKGENVSRIQDQNVTTSPQNKGSRESTGEGILTKDSVVNDATRDSPLTELTSGAEKQTKTETPVNSHETSRKFGIIKPGAENSNLKISEPNANTTKAPVKRSAKRSQRPDSSSRNDAEKLAGSPEEPIYVEDETRTPGLKPLPQPCNPSKFPRFRAMDASVYIFLSDTDTAYQYKLNHKRLADVSELFKQSLQDEVREIAPELMGEHLHLKGMKKPVRYELIWSYKTKDWLLERRPFTTTASNANKDELKPNRKSQGPPLTVLRKFHNLISLIYNGRALLYPNKENVILECVDLARLATKYGPKCLNIASQAMRGAYGQLGPNIFRDAKNDPPLLLEFAEIMQYGPLYKEAMIHLVGAWENWKLKLKFLQPATLDLVNSKHKSLERRKERVNTALSANGIGFNGEPVRLLPEDKSMFDAFIIQALWVEFFKKNIREVPAPSIGDFYRLLAKGGDSYLSTQSVTSLLEHYRGQDFGYWDEVGEDLAIMKDYAVNTVQPLVVNNSELDVEKHKITWLTCTDISDDEFPWVSG